MAGVVRRGGVEGVPTPAPSPENSNRTQGFVIYRVFDCAYLEFLYFNVYSFADDKQNA